ncbi:MAG: ABC transporter permease [Candidatus Buchananbacteria bacterium]|nr:ABC transporter permease [Candidatus Buchananbacteria bacterium]
MDIIKKIKLNFWIIMVTPFRVALRSLRTNKVRTLLTVLGIVIGITAVITVMSAGEGLKSYVVGQVETFGTDAIQVEIKVPNTGKTSSENSAGIAQGIQITTLTIDDAKAIKKLPNVLNNYTSIIGQEIVSYENENKQALLWGASASFVDIDASKVETGRFFTEEEDTSLANVVVLGNSIKEKLFGDADPLDKFIKVGKQKFRVIGVMEKRGAIAFFDMDSFIYVPVQTLQKKVMGIDHVIMIFNKVADQSRADETAEEIIALLRERHDITDPDKDDFSVTTMAEALSIYETIFGAINLLLVAIAGISLLVGGIGIMNIMYVSVTERTYEIGLRKAVGATASNILWQFLWEAVVITLFGALIGVILGIGLSFLVSLIASSQGVTLKFIVSPESMIIAASVSLAIGLVFGVFPARAAAGLDPVDALRKSN